MIASLSEFDSPRLSLHSRNESKKRSMIKELRLDYRKCFTNSALSSTAKRFSPTTLQSNLTGFSRRRNRIAKLSSGQIAFADFGKRIYPNPNFRKKLIESD
jgi:hypothetical protein